jgi:hypothetical protein
MLASALDPLGNKSLTLEVRGEEKMAAFYVRESEGNGDPTVKLPIYPHTEHSLPIAAAALLRFGGKIEVGAQRLLLPIAP